MSWQVEGTRFQAALRAETFKVVRRRMTYILLGALSLLVLIFYILLWLRIREGPHVSRSGRTDLEEWLALKSAMSFLHVIPYGLALERLFATILCVVFAGTVMGNEYDWRTAGLVTARGVRRWHFLAAKVIVVMAFTVVAVVTGLLVSMAISAWFSNVYGLDYGGVSGPRFLNAAASVSRTSFAIFPFVFLALLGATLLRSAGQAVGAALGVFFIEGIFTGLLSGATTWMAHVPEALLGVNVDAVMRANGQFEGANVGPLIFASGDAPLWRGVLILLAWIGAFAVMAFVRFQRRDIQG